MKKLLKPRFILLIATATILLLAGAFRLLVDIETRDANVTKGRIYFENKTGKPVLVEIRNIDTGKDWKFDLSPAALAETHMALPMDRDLPPHRVSISATLADGTRIDTVESIIEQRPPLANIRVHTDRLHVESNPTAEGVFAIDIEEPTP